MKAMLKQNLNRLIKKGEIKMCFIQKSPKVTVPEVEEKVIRHEADASLTKKSQNETSKKGFSQNIKTSPTGLQEDNNTNKKTLLGE